MDTSVIIIGTIMLVALCGPIIYFNRLKANSEKKFIKQLDDYAVSNKYTLDSHDFWSNTVIGIYKSAGKLLYVAKEGGSFAKNEINLHNVKRCRVVEVKNEDKTSVVRLELVFSYVDANTPETSLVFYDATRSNFLLSGELQLIKKWHDLVNSTLA
ncbi:MAG: hypothetical protein F9K23_03125 [Bacteroidetes bacterium]|nr:MAG: hypothetical protein F9K23_03125 [Bacteroidota bacterium]